MKRHLLKMALVLALPCTLALAQSKGESKAAAETQGITPTTLIPVGGVAAVLYGPNDWRLVIPEFTIQADSPSTPLVSVAIDIQRVGSPTRQRIFQWSQDTSIVTVTHLTSYTYRANDFPEFSGFPISAGATYDVFAVGQDTNDGVEGSTLLGRVVVPNVTGISSTGSGQVVR
jgi:hypothetical protein